MISEDYTRISHKTAAPKPFGAVTLSDNMAYNRKKEAYYERSPYSPHDIF